MNKLEYKHIISMGSRPYSNPHKCAMSDCGKELTENNRHSVKVQRPFSKKLMTIYVCSDCANKINPPRPVSFDVTVEFRSN